MCTERTNHGQSRKRGRRDPNMAKPKSIRLLDSQASGLEDFGRDTGDLGQGGAVAARQGAEFVGAVADAPV